MDGTRRVDVASMMPLPRPHPPDNAEGKNDDVRPKTRTKTKVLCCCAISFDDFETLAEKMNTNVKGTNVRTN